MKNSIILLVKECIAAHACIQTENGNVIGLFLDDLAVDHIADDAADALIAAGIGDVTEWKEKAKKHRVQVLPDGTIKQLYSDEEVEDIARQRDEYKHRAEVAERSLRVLARKFVIFAFPNGDWKELIEQLVSEIKEQAEKELAEE